MSRLTWIYLCCILCLAGGLIIAAQAMRPAVEIGFLTLVVLIGMATYGQFLEVTYGRHSYYPHFVPFFAAVVLFPLQGIVLVILIPHLLEWIKKRLDAKPFPWYIQPYNIATHVIAAAVARWVFVYLDGSLTAYSLHSTLLAVLPALLVYVVINHYLIGQILVLARDISWAESEVMEAEPLAMDAAMMSLGYLVALLWILTPWLLVLFAAPFVLFYQALKVPQLEKESNSDGKTGLWNARYFESRFQQELALARERKQNLSVVMGDLDLLRDINNNYGHLAGDAVIAGIGTIITQTIRSEDVASRFGGEEFALILPNMDLATATAVAERIRSTIEQTSFHAASSSTPIYASMSLGVASFPQDGETADELIHEADVALYRAKIQGRNRVINSTDVPHSARLLFAQAQSIPAVPPVSVPRHRGDQDGAQQPAEAAAVASPPQPELATVEVAAAISTAPAPPSAESEPLIEPVQAQTSMSKALLFYVCAVVGLGLLFSTLVFLFDMPSDLLALTTLTFLAFGAQWLQISMYEKSSVSISMAMIVAATVISGGVGAVAASAAVVMAHSIRMRPKLYKVLFNWSTHLMASLGPLLVVYLPSNSFDTPFATQQLIWWVVPVLIATFVYYVAETGLVAIAISLSEQHSLVEIWDNQFRWLAKHYLVMGVLGFFLAAGYSHMGVWGSLVFSIPVVIMHLTQKEYVSRTEKSVRELGRMNSELTHANHEIGHAKFAIERLNQELFLTLGKIIDARDPFVSGHATQVGEYARSIAVELGMDSDQVENVYRAGLLHDIGKMGIPESILHKPAKLTDEEYEIVKAHAALGAEFLETCHDLHHLAPFVRYHHERWDGRGYPEGIAGDAIPLEARILAVCDAVEAMASDRPYQRSKPLPQIVEEINRCSGTQFDPMIVDIFARVVQNTPDLVINSATKVHRTQKPRLRENRDQVGIEKLKASWPISSPA